MRSKRLFLFLLMAFFTPWLAQAQGTMTLPSVIDHDVIIPANTYVNAGDITITAGHKLTLRAGATLNAGEVIVEPDAVIYMHETAEFMHTNNGVPVRMRIYVDQNFRDSNNSGYRLIASPVDKIEVAATGLLENYDGMDLYRFDQNSIGTEWRNFKYIPSTFSKLNLMEGYLYYNSEPVFVTFFGPTVPTNLAVYTSLVYNSNSPYAGLNLLGNPFTCKTKIYSNSLCNQAMDHYVLNAAGDEIIAATTDLIAPMKGFFVVAESEGQTCYFKPVSGAATSYEAQTLQVALSANDRGTTLIDAAQVRFDDALNLPKAQLNPNHTKVYMTQNGKDYAVANGSATGEMPVNIKVESNGSYTLNFSNVNVEFTYLHLIDNMTGVEVDLLANPSYSFEARTTDYASRFRLVYATGSSVRDESFGFFNNSGDFCIYGLEGEATLQVVDMMGRVLVSEPFNGSYENQLNVAPGLYLIRLINGSDVKVQKTVVK